MKSLKNSLIELNCRQLKILELGETKMTELGLVNICQALRTLNCK